MLGTCIHIVDREIKECWLKDQAARVDYSAQLFGRMDNRLPKVLEQYSCKCGSAVLAKATTGGQTHARCSQ